MRRPAQRSWQAGLLLVEAVLAAVVTAVGLVFISRSFSGQLKALSSVQRYDTLLLLARSTLNELEGRQLAGLTGLTQVAGMFEAPYAAYHWALEAAPREDWLDPAGNPLMYEVTVSVASDAGTPSALRVSALWPSSWVSP